MVRKREEPESGPLTCLLKAGSGHGTGLTSAERGIEEKQALSAVISPQAVRLMSVQALPPDQPPTARKVSSSGLQTTPSYPNCQPVGSSSTSTPPDADHRTKPRASRACSSCNRQKLRCDGAHPCSRCVTLNITTSCEYLPSLRGKTRKRRDKEGRDGGEKRHRENSAENSSREDPQLMMWKKDNSFHGPTNSALWGEGRPPPNHHLPSFLSSPDEPSPVTNRSVSLNEKLTTLPLPGDAHNPLAVLAEASATAHTDHHITSPHVQMSSTEVKSEGAGGYYMPLERVFKDEAPHIMGYIKVHEYVVCHKHVIPPTPGRRRKSG